MLKRAFAALTFAFALVALNTVNPTTISAQTAIDEPVEEEGGDCLIWCVTHNTHHRIRC